MNTPPIHQPTTAWSFVGIAAAGVAATVAVIVLTTDDVRVTPAVDGDRPAADHCLVRRLPRPGESGATTRATDIRGTLRWCSRRRSSPSV